MAQIVWHGSGRGASLVAEDDDERDLLRSGQRAGGRVVLDDGYYAVRGDRVLLPDGISEGACQRLARELERSARSHRRALARRKSFRIAADRAHNPPRSRVVPLKRSPRKVDRDGDDPKGD